MIRKIVLIGVVAVGKTEVGRLLAENLEMFFTTTKDLMEYENHSMEEIKKQFGQEGVEKYKNRTIAGIRDLQNAVIVASDDCLETEEQRGILCEDSLVVHLYSSSESTATRLKKRGEKKKLSIYDIEELQRKLIPIYNKMADVKISVNRKKPEAIVEQIIIAVAKCVGEEN